MSSNNQFYDQYNMYYSKNSPYQDYGDILNQSEQCIDLRDYGPMPYVVNIHDAANQNYNFRLALWTGTHLQLTLMNIHAGEDIGLEVHPNVDQFLRIEEGTGLVLMGNSKDNLWFQKKVYPGYAIFVPARTWHNVINIGCTPLKLYSIYAPPTHPHGTIYRTKKEAEMEHEHY
jgi:mannose-6-phosphate isomerase-like protein (cupin superfamily)